MTQHDQNVKMWITIFSRNVMKKIPPARKKENAGD